REHKLSLGLRTSDAFNDIAQCRQNTSDLFTSASGQNGQYGPLRIQPIGTEELVLRFRGADRFDERVAYEFNGHTGFLINTFFEGKDDEHLRNEGLDLFDTALPPRPHLR